MKKFLLAGALMGGLVFFVSFKENNPVLAGNTTAISATYNDTIPPGQKVRKLKGDTTMHHHRKGGDTTWPKKDSTRIKRNAPDSTLK